MRCDSSSSRRSSASEPDGAEVVYWKDNVTIHPTQYASERISGRLKLIKQGPSLFMVLSFLLHMRNIAVNVLLFVYLCTP